MFPNWGQLLFGQTCQHYLFFIFLCSKMLQGWFMHRSSLLFRCGCSHRALSTFYLNVLIWFGVPFWKLLLWGFHHCFCLYLISLPGLYVSCPAVGAKWGWSEGLPFYRQTNYLPALGLVMGRSEHRILETHSLTVSPSLCCSPTL